ncbi:MAG: YdeI/OmpD-associated family protein [Bacteroidia bacterium]
MAAVTFKAKLEKFGSQGEKTGWTYIEIPAKIAAKIKPGTKKSFRIKGKIDDFAFKGGSVLPMGEGDFIFAINATIRKKIKKFKGDVVTVVMEEDKAPVKYNKDLLDCLKEDKKAQAAWDKIPNSHKNYYSKWVDSAKTDATKAKRIAMVLDGLPKGWTFGEMLRATRENKIN